jgi:putative DNA primase/helicase
MIVTHQDTEMRDYALRIFNLGFNVVPMHTDKKAPALPTWKQYYHQRQTERDIFSFNWTRNIGIISGINNIRVIDLDGCDNAETVFTLLEHLGLDYSYQWIVHSPGKGGGFHVYIQCPDSLTLTTRGVIVGDPLIEGQFKQLELRWFKCCTMFPPSIHPEVQAPYDWAFGIPEQPIATVPLTIVEKAFLAMARPQVKASTQQPEKTTIKKYDLWAQKAFTQEAEAVRNAPEGSRNDQLNKSAYNLGQIVGAGLLEAGEVEEELLRAAMLVGLREDESTATIKSGIDAGSKLPRMPKQVYRENEPAFKLAPARKVDDQKLASFSADDQGHAEAAYSLYGPYIAFNDAYGWLIWNGTHYTASIQRINALIIDTIRRRQRAAAHLERADLAKISRCNAGTVSAVRSLLENLALVHVDEFDCEPDLINTMSGIVNLRTKKLLPHDPHYRFTWCSPIRYIPNATSDLWLDFIDDTVASDDIAIYLQQALGYSITGHTNEESLFYIFGPPRSGKGTLSETIMAIFPRPICLEVDFNTFTQKREGDNQNFDLAPMKAARIVFASESNKYQSLNPAKVKALTGGNFVSCAFKYGNMFSYQPQYTVWLSSNHEVNGDPDDDALWGRVKVVHFPNSRLGREDKSLKRRMQAPETLECVLAWLVEGAYQWYQLAERGLQTPQSVTAITQKQRADQDSIGLWIDQCTEQDPDYWTENTKARSSYENWCSVNGYEPKKANGFSRSLTAHNLEVGAVKRLTTGPGETTTARGIRGIRLI